MRWKLEIIHKLLIALCVSGLLWAIWASGQGESGATILEFAKPRFHVRENDRRATIQVSRIGGTNTTSTVEVTTEDQTARAGIDYTAISGPITIAPGRVTAEVFVPIMDNLQKNGNRHFRVILKNPAGGALIGAVATAEVEIEDNDSRQTAWLTFGLHAVPPLQPLFWGIPRWQYVASLIYVFLAFYLSKLLDFIVRRRLRRLAERTEKKWDDLLLDLLRGPIKVIIFVILLHLGLRIFSWPEWMATFLSKGLRIVLAVSLTYMGLKFVDLATRYWTQRATDQSDLSFNEQLLPIIRNTLKVFVVIVAMLLTLQNLGLNITSLLASVSIGGLALSLAAQDTLSNFFGAIAVLVDKPFQIGDQIKFENVEGTVEAIGFRSTRLRNVDGFLVSIPNKTMGNVAVINMSKRARIRTLMDIGLPHDTSAEKVQRALDILREVLSGHPMTDDLQIGFNKFTDSSLNISVVHWWKNNLFKDYLAGMEEINLSVKKRFDQERIEFAFPTRTVYLKSDAAPPDGQLDPPRR